LVRSLTIIVVVVITIAAGASGAWLFLTPRTPRPEQEAASRLHDFFKSRQDYPTSGGQQMKPRW
jgi:Ti type entry exclusion protein TrbK